MSAAVREPPGAAEAARRMPVSSADHDPADVSEAFRIIAGMSPAARAAVQVGNYVPEGTMPLNEIMIEAVRAAVFHAVKNRVFTWAELARIAADLGARLTKGEPVTVEPGIVHSDGNDFKLYSETLAKMCPLSEESLAEETCLAGGPEDILRSMVENTIFAGYQQLGARHLCNLALYCDGLLKGKPAAAPQDTDLESTSCEIHRLADVIRGVHAMLSDTGSKNSSLSFSQCVLSADATLDGLADDLDRVAETVGGK